MDEEQRQFIESLYLEMYNKLIVFASCAFPEEGLAEEAVQETFRIACQKADQICDSENPRGWLVNTLKFTIRNMRRSRESGQQLLSRFPPLPHHPIQKRSLGKTQQFTLFRGRRQRLCLAENRTVFLRRHCFKRKLLFGRQ
jgi:DNA-directed RNA polymerase specialized sigma24 family protein